MANAINRFAVLTIVCFCLLGCTSKVELDPLVNPVVEIEGKPNQKIYVTYDRINGKVVNGEFFGDSSNNPGTRLLDEQGQLKLTFEQETHGLNVRIVNLDSNSLRAVAKADNAKEDKGEVADKLECIHLMLGFQFDKSTGGSFYRSPESWIESAVKEASNFE